MRDVSKLILEPDDADHESLVRCLAALLRDDELTVSHEELCCLLGTAVMTSYAAAADETRRWNVFGRHAFLKESAALYGLDLRELHPPEAAPGLPVPIEFDWHFRDSYLPLIRASLEKGEPVLAWMGWQGPCRVQWGIVTGIERETFVGVTTRGRAVLNGPAIQVYQVARPSPRRPTAEELAATILRHAGMVLGHQLPASFGVVTGLPAIDVMERRIQAVSSLDHDEAAATGRLLTEVLRGVVRGREAMCAVFSELLPGLRPATAARVGDCLTLLGNTAGGLSPWVSEDKLVGWMLTPSPWKTVEPVVELWRTSEDALSAALNPDR